MNRGIEVFCNHKEVNTNKTVKAFKKETGLLAEDNFNKFAAFVDKQIKTGVIKGNAAPINKEMWDEEKEKKAQWNAEMNSFTSEQKKFYNKIKKSSMSTLDSFFGIKQIQKPRQQEATTKLGKLIPVFDYLKQNGLMEEFLNYEQIKK